MPIIDTRGRGAFAQLPQTLLAAMVQKQELELRKEDQKLRKSALELEQEEAAVAAEKQRIEMVNRIAQFGQLARRAQAGDEEALAILNRTPIGDAARAGNGRLIQDLIIGQQTRPTPTQPSPLETAQGRVERDRLKADLIARAGDVGGALGQSLDATEVGATPAVAGEVFSRAAPPTEAAEASLEATRTTTALAKLRLERDHERVARAEALWRGGATWGEARKAAGLAEGGIPDEDLFSDPSARNAGGEQARKMQGFARQMNVANSIINSTIDEIGGISFLAAFERQTQNQTISALLNATLSPEQQNLVNAQRLFSDAYRFSLSGQQSSDREALRMMLSISEQFGDSEQVMAQKRLMREVIIDMTFQAANGLIDRVSAMDQVISKARQLNMDEDLLRMFVRDRDIARQNQGQELISLRDDPVTADGVEAAMTRLGPIWDAVFGSNSPAGN